MAAPQTLGGLIGQQRTVGEEVAAGQLGLHYGPVALTAGVATRADRAQRATIALADQAQVIEQLSPQRDAGHPGHRVLARLDRRAGDGREGAGADLVVELERQRSNVHLSGAPSPRPIRLSQVASSQVTGHLSRLSAEAAAALDAALADLPPEQREPIRLAFYEGFTHERIAALLQQPLGTVKTRIRMGMMRLRERFREKRPEPTNP